MATGEAPRGWMESFMGGGVAAGLVLVFLPGAALFFGIEWINRYPGAGLPLMAIFGIMILFGALSLTSTLFARLKLSNANEALALPAGSIRAAIAMSLIVLFAIISIMLYQSMLTSNWVTGIGEADKERVLKEPKNQVTAVLPAACAASAVAPAIQCSWRVWRVPRPPIWPSSCWC